MTLEEKITTINKTQTPRLGGDFTQVKRKIEDGIDYEVHEYGNPKDKYWGYQIIFHEKREDGEYTKSIGYGKETESRTHDWNKIRII